MKLVPTPYIIPHDPRTHLFCSQQVSEISPRRPSSSAWPSSWSAGPPRPCDPPSDHHNLAPHDHNEKGSRRCLQTCRTTISLRASRFFTCRKAIPRFLWYFMAQTNCLIVSPQDSPKKWTIDKIKHFSYTRKIHNKKEVLGITYLHEKRNVEEHHLIPLRNL